MDTTDPNISFNDAGECQYVTDFRERLRPSWDPAGNAQALEALFNRIRTEGRTQDYDCILGLSGGVDSSYLAYLAWRHKLRPLVVHTDTGWNSELAVQNIERIVQTCGFDLQTFVVYWPEMQDLQRAFLKAAVPNQDIPQDHAIFAAFYGLAAKHRIRWVLSGQNFAGESILPKAWGYDAKDLRHLRGIHRLFGERPLQRFPQMGYLRQLVRLRLLGRFKFAKPLNLVQYNLTQAIDTLSNEFGWRYYGAKHFESRFTKFFQGWYLPAKFGYDKRLAHYSSLILSGQMSRAEALEKISHSSYSQADLVEDQLYVQKKLGASSSEFHALLALEPQPHDRYPSHKATIGLANRLRGFAVAKH